MSTPVFSKTAVMIGAGNVGRGFVGASFAASGFETVFIDVDERLVGEINACGAYPVRTLLADGGQREIVVRGIRAVDGKDTAAAAAEIARADICATAVGVRAIPQIASMLALGLALRARGGGRPLDIIVCENMIDAGDELRSQVLNALPAGLVSAVEARTGFVEAVIGRMTPIQTEEMRDGDPLRICTEKYAFLPVDKGAFKGPVPQIEGLVPLDDFKYYVKRKLFVHNLGHAAVAYLGLLKGYTYIAEAADDADILFIVSGAMRESAAALACENRGDAANLSRHIDSLLYRFSNRALGDTCARVAADPARKLGRRDRFVGALENCENYGVPAVCISAAAAAAALALEKAGVDGEVGPSLAEITGLSSDSPPYRQIMTFGTICASASARDAGAAVAALRRAAVKLSGGITIL